MTYFRNKNLFEKGLFTWIESVKFHEVTWGDWAGAGAGVAGAITGAAAGVAGVVVCTLLTLTGVAGLAAWLLTSCGAALISTCWPCIVASVALPEASCCTRLGLLTIIWLVFRSCPPCVTTCQITFQLRNLLAIIFYYQNKISRTKLTVWNQKVIMNKS